MEKIECTGQGSYGEESFNDIQCDQITSLEHEPLNCLKAPAIPKAITDSQTAHLKEMIRLMEAQYQPFYGLDESKFSPVRSTIDRAELLLTHTNITDLASGKVNLLDAGTSCGYIPFYFADRGAHALGIDSNINMVNTANFIKDLNGVNNVDFKVADFNKAYIENLPKDLYTHAVVFSLFHHINAGHGLEYTQNMIYNMMKKIPVAFIELAVKEEKADYPWVKKLPSTPEMFFIKCDCNYEIISNGSTQTHKYPGSTAPRPIYKLTRK